MKKVNILFLAGSLLSLLFAGRLAAQPAPIMVQQGLAPGSLSDIPAHFWITNRLTSPPQFSGMSDRSLALDAAGQPHIAYGRHSLFYTWYDGTNWHREIVDEAHIGAGLVVSLALDGNGTPHIAYSQWNYPEKGLFYATRAASGWVHDELDDRAVGYVSIALDSSGYSHIAYSLANDALGYMYQTSDGWHSESVDESAPVGISLALDQANIPHISYLTTLMSQDYLRHAVRVNNQWQIENVQPIIHGYSAGNASIALDNQGRLAIAFQSGYGLRYAAHTGQGWVVEPLNNDAYALWLSLALDAAGVPHLAYYDSHLDSQMYTTRPAATWLTTPVATQLDSGRYNSVALDQQGQPHISYAYYPPDLYPEAGVLQYAHLVGDDWILQSVDSAGWHSFPHLAIDSSDNLHVIYFNASDNLWHYLYQTETGWTAETLAIPPARYDQSISFLLDGDNDPHVVYYDANDDLRYAHRMGGQWDSQLIIEDTATEFVRYTALALDQNQQPHVAFHHRETGRLYYAHLDGIVWVEEVIEDKIGQEYDSLSLQLDSLDHPHLVYTYYANVRYAQRPAAQWLIENLTQGEKGSLALDSQDRPHIAYYDGYQDKNSIYYTHWTGSSWTTEWLDSASPWNINLLLDGNDEPHVAYQEISRLKYAHHDGSSWAIYQLNDGYGNLAGYDLSLALDSQDTPFILHQNYYNSHLLLSQPADITYSPLIFKP